MSAPSVPAAPLAHFPIMLFASTMGLGGLVLAYQKLALLVGLPLWPFVLLSYADTLLFALLAGAYGLKILRYPQMVRAEIEHPVKLNFFGAVTISLFLLSTIWDSAVLFVFSLLLQTLLSFFVIGLWIRRALPIAALSPAWFIPVVGNLFVPLAAHGGGVLVWYYFSLGFFFWIVLFVLIFYRLLFHESLPPRLRPTLFILLAPPALSFTAYVKLSGGVNHFALFVLGMVLFFAGLLLSLWRDFRRVPFSLSCWAYTFPSAAACVALLGAYEQLHKPFYLAAGLAMFAFLLAALLWVGGKTLAALFSGALLRPD